MLVEVSGRQFVFPFKCVCCLAEPDHEFELSSTRITGSRVIRTQTRSWNVPVCDRCSAHDKAFREAGRWGALLWTGGILGLLIGLALLIQMVAFLVGQDATAPHPIAAIAWTGAGIAAIQYQRTRTRDGRALARELRSPQCTADTFLQSRYLGWSGSVHSFEFASSQYALAFMRDNRSKLVNLTVEARKALDSTSK
jgi:hypothetical protein